MLKHQQTVLPASPADSSPMPRTAFQGSTQVSPGTAWLQLQVLFYMPELLSRSTYHHSMCASPHRAQGWLWKWVWRAFPEKMTAGKKSNSQHNFWHGRQFRKYVILLQVHSLGGFYFYSGFPTSPHPSLFLSFLGMTHPIFLWWLETLHREDISHILNNTYWIKDDECEKLCYSVFYFSGGKKRFDLVQGFRGFIPWLFWSPGQSSHHSGQYVVEQPLTLICEANRKRRVHSLQGALRLRVLKHLPHHNQ